MQDRPRQHRQSHAGGQGRQHRQLQRRSGRFSGSSAVAAGQRGGYRRHQAYRQGIDKRRRQHEQRHAEGVFAIQGGGLRRCIAKRVPQGGRHQRLVQQGDQAHARRAHGDGYAGPQQLPQYAAACRGYVAHFRQCGPPGQQQGGDQQAQARPGGDTADGPGGAQVRPRTLPQQVQAQPQPDEQLAGGLRHLSGGGRHHIAQPLGIAPQRRRQAYQQHRRPQRPQGRGRVRIVERGGQGLRQQAHNGGTHQPQRRQQGQAQVQAAAHGAIAPLGGGTGHHAAQGHRQSRRGQHQQQTVNVVRGVEMRHALPVQQVPQRDLVQGTQQLCHRHSPGQNGRAAHEVLPPVGHGASLSHRAIS